MEGTLTIASVSSDFNRPGGSGLPPELERLLTRIFSDQTLVITIVVVIILIGLVIALVLALLAALGHGAMVDMVREADETETTSFNTGWRTGLRRMLPTFLIRFLLGLPSFIIIMAGLAAFLVSFIPLVSQAGFRDAERLFAGGMLATLFLCFLPACCLGILLDIPLRVLETLSIRALVLEDRGIWGSIRRGWNILTTNLGDVVVVWLIFFLIGIGVARRRGPATGGDCVRRYFSTGPYGSGLTDLYRAAGVGRHSAGAVERGYPQRGRSVQLLGLDISLSAIHRAFCRSLQRIEE